MTRPLHAHRHPSCCAARVSLRERGAERAHDLVQDLEIAIEYKDQDFLSEGPLGPARMSEQSHIGRPCLRHAEHHLVKFRAPPQRGKQQTYIAAPMWASAHPGLEEHVVEMTVWPPDRRRPPNPPGGFERGEGRWLGPSKDVAGQGRQVSLVRQRPSRSIAAFVSYHPALCKYMLSLV